MSYPPKFSFGDATEVARGELSPGQIMVLDMLLEHHGLPKSSPHATPETLAKVCLLCGSVAVAESREARDTLVENFDMTCCGLTVIFHSSHRVLVDPANLVEVRQEV